ncbi:flagellar biosynthesis protein FlhF [Vreelandella titanicae]|jgi:flagellar biosynthesis protein FlhF|uniref:Flagellar biosynthesis protein FlhF n=1 Tax=Vreelandella titanicae BH1 TaxID=1204738 RepID=L9U662_9GAMM|nr:MULTISPECIES: flagellar biosynthesis protein FlhF [Halomonas]ELY20354.1 Signal-recognition particle (SRP)-type GTPase [Halomonas titanicae BH1]KIN13115.1 flagellar biosynthesis protein [Halomonas sp. KHS3]MCD1587881.1 flagellar biosynthesis protein FlhF [Halomonas sp. IOP_14]NVE92867.1 flagellar biosynthesis protein FlhF [Halomonas titanicae]|tara:strand:+ start:2022 stop:4205 length:2184 start_codon:yes stop_codon:yes gene_type:complete
MSVRRFVGANSRDVMRQVRETLGEDALIVANRRTEGGVEILAMADEAIDHFEPSPEPAPPETPTAPPAQDPMQAMSERLLREMQDMRALLANSQSTHTASPSPAAPTGTAARLRQLLWNVGFSSEIADELLAGLPASLTRLDGDSEAPLQWLRQQLMDRLYVLNDEASFFDQTGIVALVGPTGVGKTTTTAKLAARFVMRHGTRPVALVTTDSFRIGAHEQLRIYARLLDTPMYALDAEQPIDDLLGRLQGKQWVIIDTVGMSQRDQRVIEQIAHLQGGRSRVRLVLLLNAASQPETLEEVVLRYRQAARAAGAELDDCIITKQDEAGRLAPVLDIIMRHGMRVLFGSNGQQVPEDMALAAPDALVDQALSTATPQRERVQSADAPMGMPRWSRDVLGQGRRLSSLLARLRQRVTGFAELEEIWNLASLPSRLQETHLDALLAGYPAAKTTLGMAWFPRRNERGCDWAMPDIGLDTDGAWLALPWLQHRHAAGWQPRLAALSASSGVAVHLLPRFPEPDALAWLEAEHLTWVSQVAPSHRLRFHHERQSIRQLFSDSVLTHHVGVRFRGQSVQLWTAYAEVEDASGTALLAWFGEVRDPESAKVVARRYWLTPARLGAEVLSLLLTQLQSEGLAALTRRAWQQLKEADSGDLNAEVRLLMASGVASVAGHLDVADDEEAQTLRGDLLNLLGNSRRRRDTGMLDALVYAFMARDAIRQMGSVSREGVV